ncbi:MAG TPA: hypothetical protein VG474_08735, partial [Solirubrobacteraceae bacterium]|nr:hypothetical protein [Solirubrobacteraceae bacterium]
MTERRPDSETAAPADSAGEPGATAHDESSTSEGAKDTAQDAAASAKDKTQDAAASAKDKTQDAAASAKDKAEDVAASA